jgi:hypothetical protein
MRHRLADSIGGPPRLAPHLAGQELQRLFFPVWAHLKMWTARAAFRTHNLLGQRRHFDIVGKLRHVDQRRVTAGVIQAGRNQPLHAECAHVAEGHRRAGRLLGLGRHRADRW